MPKEMIAKMIKKTYVLSADDLETMKSIREKALDQKLVLNDSHIVRLGLTLLSRLSAKEISHLATHLPKASMGRPKKVLKD